MDPRTNLRPGAWRSMAATVGLASAAVALARLGVAAMPGVPAPDAVVSCLVLGLGALAATVLATGCAMLTVAALATALGHSWSRLEVVACRLVPMLLRRTLAVGLGAGVAMGLAPAALADEVDVGWQVTTEVTTEAGASMASEVAPQETPIDLERPDTAALTAASFASPGHAAPSTGHSPTATDPAPPAPTTSVTVQPGDSLWTITAGLLPADSADAEVAATWPVLYTANRDTIGPDPGLIHPGDVLTVPTGISA